MIRAILAFIALPGVVAFAVPVAIGMSTGHPVPYWPAALVPLCLGTLILLWSVREFYVAGRGTLAPWAPPKQLVITGPYRYSRNPMYVGVLAILIGWTSMWDSRALLIYLLAVFCAVYLRVLLAEERWAARRFGSDWDAYRMRVPRWLF
jgi:protein-S-isoprenylcysteine O-methyltransferase Ste14